MAAAKTRDEVVNLVHDTIEFHIEGLRLEGEPVPEPVSSIEFVEVAG